MRNTSFTITVPHIFSPISAFSADGKSNIIALRFKIHGTLQIKQSNFVFSKAENLVSMSKQTVST